MLVKKIVILFSGEGSNLENLIKKLHKKFFESFSIEVVAAITNNPNANGIQRAKKLGISTIIINHKEYKDRESFDKKLVKTIDTLNVDLTILAGFMRILTPVFTETIKSINIHPSILPLFKGANALKRSFESNMKIGGVSVHFVNQEVDSGEIILQECFQKDSSMDLKTFTDKIHKLEYNIFPKAVIEALK